MWYEDYEDCNKICTIKSQNLSCFDPPTKVKAVLQFDINLPVNTYSFGTCKSCFNFTLINITCTLVIKSTKFEPCSTQNEETITSKIISEPFSTQNEELTTSYKLSKSSGKKLSFVFDVKNILC